MKRTQLTFAVPVWGLLLLAACGGGGGGSEPNWYYHFICNGDSECLSTNFAGASSGTSNQGPGAGGQSGCNSLLQFGTNFWNIPPAQQWCDNSANSTAPVPTVSISALPTDIVVGQHATLTWSSTNATSCTASGAWSGSRSTSGTQQLTGTSAGTGTYTLTCYGALGSAANSATLTVAPAPAVTISVSPASISNVQTATLTWSTVSVTSCTASGAWTGSKALSGGQTVSSSAPGSYTYTLNCTGSNGTASNSATLLVTGPPSVGISVSPTSVSVGQNATLTWSSANVTSCNADGPWSGAKALSGFEDVSSATAGSYAYTLSCIGPQGSASSSAVLTVGSSADPAPAVSISVAPANITEGESATLTWTSANVTSCTSSGSWIGSQPLSGNQTVSPTAGSYSYALSCSGAGGTASSSATLTVSSSSTPPPAPTVDISVSPPGVNGGESATLTWSSTNATNCTASGPWTGAKVPSGSEAVTTPAVAGIYSYTLMCSGTGGSGSDSTTISVEPAAGTGVTARFNGPHGVATDSNDNIYVADYGNSTIRKLTPAGSVSTLAGLAGASGYVDGTGIGARFWTPSDVATNAEGTVYVVEGGSGALRAITPGGVVSTLAGSQTVGNTDGAGAAASFRGPYGIATDSAGNIYVADTGNGSIRKSTPAGVVTTFAGGTVYGCTDGTGAGAAFGYPYGIAADSSDNIYVADQYCHTIRKIAPSGVVTTIAGSAGTAGSADGTGAAARFDHPWALATDSADNVYVADTYNHTIRKITPSAVVTTFAGTAGMSGSADGTGAAARFQLPRGVAIDSADNVFVGDTTNCTIRKIAPAGVVTTIAGQPGNCGSNN
jgi:hypothetical protein